MSHLPYATTHDLDPRGILQVDWRTALPQIQVGDIIDVTAPNIAVRIIFGVPPRLWRPEAPGWRYIDDESHLAMYGLLARGEVRSLRAAAARVSSDSTGASPAAIVDRLRRGYDHAQFLPKSTTLSSV